MPKVPNREFPVIPIVVKDKYRYPKNSPEAKHLAEQAKMHQAKTAREARLAKQLAEQQANEAIARESWQA